VDTAFGNNFFGIILIAKEYKNLNKPGKSFCFFNLRYENEVKKEK
jgi:hypothetical protein